MSEQRLTNELSLPQQLREQSTYLFPKAADTLMSKAADEIERLRSALEEAQESHSQAFTALRRAEYYMQKELDSSAAETRPAPEQPVMQARFCDYKGELVRRIDGAMVCPECGNGP